MESTIQKVSSIRIYTGSGYEDFRKGELVRGEHVFGEKVQAKVIEIKVFLDGTICICFEDKAPFWYNGKFNYRITN